MKIRKLKKETTKKRTIPNVVKLIIILLVFMLVCYLIFISIKDDDKIKISNCNDKEDLLKAVQYFQKNTVMYKYFKDERPLVTSISEVNDYDGIGCIINQYSYIYIKQDNKVYGYDALNDYIEKDLNIYDSKTLWMYLKDYIIKDDVNEKYPNYCIVPTKYNNTNKYRIEVRECVDGEYEFKPDFKYTGKLISTYIIDLNTKKYTVEEYNENGTVKCDVDNDTLLKLIIDLQKKDPMYKYFSNERSLATKIDSAYSNNNGKECIITSYQNQKINDSELEISSTYAYIKNENKVYPYDPIYDIVEKDSSIHFSQELFGYLKDFFLANDISEKYSNYCYHPTLYDNSDIYNLDIRECVNEELEYYFRPGIKYKSKLIASYIVDLKAKTYTVKTY